MAPTPQISSEAIVEKMTAGATKPTSPEGVRLIPLNFSCRGVDSANSWHWKDGHKDSWSAPLS